MKVKSFKKAKDWKDSWLQTAVSILALAFLILVNLGVLTPEQAEQAQPIITTTLGAVSTIILGVSSLIGIFFKHEPS
jgi:hypothetical protein